MGLTMSQRQAVTKTIAVRYKRASQVEKGTILDELCATTGWHRNHARKAPGQGLRPMVVRPRRPRVPKYGEDVVVGLRFCCAALADIAKVLSFPLLGIDSDYADLVTKPTPPRIAVSGRESALIRSA